MTEHPDTVRSVTIMRISDGTVFAEVAITPEAEAGFPLAKGIHSQLKEFDKKRKDDGSIPQPSGVLHYLIDSESIAHILYTSKDYPARAAMALLKELVQKFEKVVPEPDEADAEKVRKSMSGHAKDLLVSYRVAPDLPDVPAGATDEKIKGMNLKVEEAKDKMAKNIKQASENQDDLMQVDDKGKRLKLMAAEMEYETDDLKDSMTWRNRKLMIIGGIVGGALILAILIAVLK